MWRGDLIQVKAGYLHNGTRHTNTITGQMEEGNRSLW